MLILKEMMKENVLKPVKILITQKKIFLIAKNIKIIFLIQINLI